MNYIRTHLEIIAFGFNIVSKQGSGELCLLERRRRERESNRRMERKEGKRKEG